MVQVTGSSGGTAVPPDTAAYTAVRRPSSATKNHTFHRFRRPRVLSRNRIYVCMHPYTLICVLISYVVTWGSRRGR